MNLSSIFAERVASGLKRKSIVSPSRWACEYRMMGMPYPGKWSFKYHPWLREMHDSTADVNIGQKSAQMGYTETVLNLTFYQVDVQNNNCLYLLPTKQPDANEFSAARFDAAVEASPHLASMFSSVQNVGHKRAGSANVYIRGSNSRSALKSIPTGFIVFDELDEMNQGNISLAEQRAAGQKRKQFWKISTPTAPGRGINAEYLRSTQEHFIFQCPKCSKFTELLFPECMVITADEINDPRLEESHLICKECKNRLEHEEKVDFLAAGEWQPEFKGRDARGFYINQLYSTTVTPKTIAQSFLKAQTNKFSEQEFHNSIMGNAYIAAGSVLTDLQIEECIGSYRRLAGDPSGLITMGIDVGNWLHVVVNRWDVKMNAPPTDINMYARSNVIWFGKVRQFEELDDLMRRFNIIFAVVDAQPEKRKSLEFVMRFWGRAKMCFYGNDVKGRVINASNTSDQAITVDRTSWLDITLGRYHTGKRSISVPADIDLEYKSHLKALVRRYEENKSGEQVGTYINVGDDHYAHAQNYSEIALAFALGTGRSSNINTNMV